MIGPRSVRLVDSYPSLSLMTAGFPFTNDDLARSVLSVAQLNRAVAQLLEDGVPAVWVRGEISNFTQAASGHWYFTLKDERAGVRAVMFRGRAQSVGFVPRAGDRVELRARVSLYEPRGDYQLQVEALRRAGQGDLYEAFLRLKEKLSAEGLFDPARKRDPVRMPACIGVITSLQAAALRDVLSALRRRAPHVRVVIYPAPVQGLDAAPRLAAAIATANRLGHADTLLLVRGGGSIEDLWSFNDETLARAIAASELPVISGVGHETDFTIADFVADLRAPTPTAAAELACLPRAELLNRVFGEAQALARAQRRQLDRAAQRLDRAAAQLVSPAQWLAHQRERLQGLRHRLTAAWARPQVWRRGRLDLLAQRLTHRAPDLTRRADRLAAASRRLGMAHARLLAARQARLAAAGAQLRALDPGLTLARGYSIARDAEGRIVRDATALAPGQALELSFAQGGAQVEVLRTREGGEPS